MVYTFYDNAHSSMFLPPDVQAEYLSIEELKISRQEVLNIRQKKREVRPCPTGSILSRQEVLNIRQQKREVRPCLSTDFVARQKVLNGEETRRFPTTLLIPTIFSTNRLFYLPSYTDQVV
ncbi:7750_t:CDS:2, partial [Funneliformis caledonium]